MNTDEDSSFEGIFDPSSLNLIMDFIDNFYTDEQIFEKTYDTSLKHRDDGSIETKLEILQENLSNLYHFFGDQLKGIQNIFLNEYRENYYTQVKKLANSERTTNLGLNFINNHEIDRNLDSISYIKALELDYWNKILAVVFQSEKFQNPISNLKSYYQQVISQKIEEELKKVPMEISESIKKEYYQKYLQFPLTFEEFLLNKETQDSDLRDAGRSTTKDSEILRKDFEEALEHKKIEQQKQDQEGSFDNYQEFFNMSERELERAKRVSASKRKFVKKSRREKFN